MRDKIYLGEEMNSCERNRKKLGLISGVRVVEKCALSHSHSCDFYLEIS